jgi:outer membrane receptor protein involved in Fe transport
MLVLHYSYDIPNPAQNIPILRHALDGWEASGVTQFTSGNPLNPICGTNMSGVENTDPSLSGIFRGGSSSLNATNARCELTGEPIFNVARDPNLAEEDQMHFNVNAFRRPKPNGSEGNLGNAPFGVLRHPGWSNWDFTVARRFRVWGRANLRVQLQVYNLFNQVEFVTMDADYLFGPDGNVSPDTGKYTATTNPRNVGLTLRFDF